MKCDEIKNIIPKVFDREAHADEINKIEEHIKKCRVCREYYMREKEIVGALRNMEHRKAPDDFTENVKNRIIADKNKRHAAFPKLILSFAAGAAAVVVLALITVRSAGQPVTYIPPGANYNPVGYQVVSSISGKKEGYIRLGINSPEDFDDVFMEIQFPEGVALVNGRKNAGWKGDLKKGKNIILLRVKGGEEGTWQIKGKLRKNGNEKEFDKYLKII